VIYLIFSISSLFLLNKSIDYIEEIIKNSEIKVWEIPNEGLIKINDRIFKKLKDLLSIGIEINIHAPFNANTYSSLNLNERKRILNILYETLDWANKLNSKYIVIHPGKKYGIDNEKEYEYAKNGIIELALKAEEYGILILVENGLKNLSYMMSDLSECINFFKYDVNEFKNIGFCLDIGHANINGKIEKYILELFDKIINIHIHDNDGSFDSHKMVGKGKVDWYKIIEILKKKEYKNYMTMEDIENPFESLNKIIGFLKNM
jgi:sugar phosphate isomerase/epimerase